MKPSQLQATLEWAIPRRENILVVGPPGTGKTDIIRSAAKASGYDMLTSYAYLNEPIDYRGVPGLHKPDGATIADFFPTRDLRIMLEADRPTVVFLDDLGWAPASVQHAVANLILARTINGEPISGQVSFVAASNRREDMAGVSGLLEPVKSRFAGIYLSLIHI